MVQPRRDSFNRLVLANFLRTKYENCGKARFKLYSSIFVVGASSAVQERDGVSRHDLLNILKS